MLIAPNSPSTLSIRRSAARSKGPMTPGYVYFIASSEGPIKIGFATSVQKRLADLQTGHIGTLFVAQHFASYAMAERLVQQRFDDLRIRREWFRFHGRMERLWNDIFDHQLRNTDLDACADGKDLLRRAEAYRFNIDEVKILLAELADDA